MRKSRLVCIAIIDSTDVFVHIQHRENATCRTSLLPNRNPFLTDNNIVGLQKLSCDHSFGVKYKNFDKNFMIVNRHHLLPLSVQIVLWMILIVCDLSVSIVSLFRNCLHFFDRSLRVESNF